MLKRASQDDFLKIKALCENSVVGTRALCYILAYGYDRPFLEIWLVLEDEDLTGVIVKFYDDVTVVLADNADSLQVKAFLEMFYYKSLMCTKKVSAILAADNCIIKNGYRFTGEAGVNDACYELDEEYYEDAYSLIAHEIPGSFSSDKESYLSFLSDFTFRKRRNLARGVCMCINGVLSSVALTSSETASSAIISGVACDRSLQKRGLGKTTVLNLVQKLKNENKEVFVIALNESAEGFYEHIGFAKAEKIAFIERK